MPPGGDYSSEAQFSIYPYGLGGNITPVLWVERYRVETERLSYVPHSSPRLSKSLECTGVAAFYFFLGVGGA